ncbi:MAG: 8-oxo-dGTP diphosphatase [Elusimicrobiota bacterium]|jgi:8-oxo-dGTP diphosphatase
MTEPDWEQWAPTESAALCFVIKNKKILLIHKKSGLGEGKVNGPGGRIEEGESPLQAAERETLEETGLLPSGLKEAGQLFFQFSDGFKLHCTVFTARSAEGRMIETDEAVPFWEKASLIPFERMWADDKLWIPWMLAGKPFRGYFCFDGDRMLSGRVIAP